MTEISELRNKLNYCVESQLDNGSLSDKEFVKTILCAEKEIEELYKKIN